MKLKNAAHTIAHCGDIAPVDTMVAIEFAASWKPFMKSNASATAINRISTVTSGVLDDDAFDDVRHVLAAIGDRLQELVDLLHLEQVLDVALLAEQLGHRAAHHLVGVAFQPVDLL